MKILLSIDEIKIQGCDLTASQLTQIQSILTSQLNAALAASSFKSFPGNQRVDFVKQDVASHPAAETELFGGQLASVIHDSISCKSMH